MATATATSSMPQDAFGQPASHLGPLTTTFTAPSSCDTANTYAYELSTEGWVYSFIQQGPASSNDGCLPSQWVVNGYYSPGVCPHGYTGACRQTQDGSETTICCPTYQHFFCASTMAAGRFGCYSGYSTITMSDVTGLGDWTDNVWPTYYDYNATIRAFSVEIHNQVITTTSDPIHTSLSILMTDSSTTTLSTQAESNSSSTLSGGAIAGIVVGVVGALALGAIGAFLLMRRRRQGDPSPPSSPTPSSDFPVQQVSLQRSMTMRHELEEQRYPSEMPQWNDRTNQEVHKPTAWELPA